MPVKTPYHPPRKHSVEIAGHKTSISLEPLFWQFLGDAASREGVPVNALVARIDAERIASPTPPGLGSAIRLWLVDWLAGRLDEAQREPGGGRESERGQHAAAEPE